MEATTVATALVNEMFFRFSPPEQLHLKQGRQFDSRLIKELCSILQIKKTRNSPYHPQGDGLVERFNRTLLDMLATTCKTTLLIGSLMFNRSAMHITQVYIRPTSILLITSCLVGRHSSLLIYNLVSHLSIQYYPLINIHINSRTDSHMHTG